MSIELQDYHKHLNHYGDFVAATKIQRDFYTPLHKLHWYQLNGMVLNDNKIELGNIRDDTRIHILAPVKSGHGKREYRWVSRAVAEIVGLDVGSPSSLHPEQLLGKVMKVKEGKAFVYKENYGYLHDDLLQFDEAYRYLNDNDPLTREVREYLKMGLDGYPNNYVYKKLVDQDKASGLGYYANAVAQFYFQPLQLNEILVLDGFLRRFNFPFVEMPTSHANAREDYLAKMKVTGSAGTGLERFCNHLKEMKQTPMQWSYSDDLNERLADYNCALVKYCFERGTKAANWADIMEWGFLNRMLKFGVILAGSRGQESIKPVHIDLAFMDVFELLVRECDFLEKKIWGDFDYGENWYGAMGHAKRCLEWLYEQGATSEEKSEITIEQFNDFVADVYKIKDRQAREKVRHLKDRGWIKLKQIYQGSKVWLAFEPKNITHGGDGGKGGNEVYDSLCDDYDKLLSKFFGKSGLIADSVKNTHGGDGGNGGNGGTVLVVDGGSKTHGGSGGAINAVEKVKIETQLPRSPPSPPSTEKPAHVEEKQPIPVTEPLEPIQPYIPYDNRFRNALNELNTTLKAKQYVFPTVFTQIGQQHDIDDDNWTLKNFTKRGYLIEVGGRVRAGPNWNELFQELV